MDFCPRGPRCFFKYQLRQDIGIVPNIVSGGFPVLHYIVVFSFHKGHYNAAIDISAPAKSN
jgi:hypothetical protein